MHSRKRVEVFLTAAFTLISSFAVLAQTIQPIGNDAKWMSQEGPGQWRISKLIGLNVYNRDNEKIGGITELIVDEGGKLDAVVVGAGGFLGVGEHDVAIPFEDVSWVYVPGVQTPANTAPPSTGASRNDPQDSAHPSADRAFLDAARARPYPDHAVINMTKERLKTAPAFKFSR
jgi:sporulation protein YlmC with PRC-barrel domain